MQSKFERDLEQVYKGKLAEPNIKHRILMFTQGWFSGLNGAMLMEPPEDMVSISVETGSVSISAVHLADWLYRSGFIHESKYGGLAHWLVSILYGEEFADSVEKAEFSWGGLLITLKQPTEYIKIGIQKND